MLENLMTGEERALHDALVGVVKDWQRLDYRHPDEIEEMIFYIHGLQRLLMAHVAMRAFPNYFTQPDKVNFDADAEK